MPSISKEFDFANWTTQLRKGFLELSILNLLAKGELYGYDLIKQLTKIQGLVVTEGTIYPLLSRLRKTGLLVTRLQESANGPARKYYRLTDDGNRSRERMKVYWNELGAGVKLLMGDSIENENDEEVE